MTHETLEGRGDEIDLLQQSHVSACSHGCLSHKETHKGIFVPKPHSSIIRADVTLVNYL